VAAQFIGNHLDAFAPERGGRDRNANSYLSLPARNERPIVF